jgi:hypothetical protein
MIEFIRGFSVEVESGLLAVIVLGFAATAALTLAGFVLSLARRKG